MKKIYAITLVLLFFGCNSNSGIDKIYNNITGSNEIVDNLSSLSLNTPARMSGSKNNADAVMFLKTKAESYGADKVWLQEVSVPYWEPGVSTIKINGEIIHSIPLGLSVGTEGKELKAEVVEIKNRDELVTKDVRGKIVFLNEPMQDADSYAKAGWQRVYGPSMVSEKGGIAVIIRSLTSIQSDELHTGVTQYTDGIKPVSALAISTNDADHLSELLNADPKLLMTLNNTSIRHSDAIGNNLIIDITGKKNPEEIILITAHLDSWFNSQGAQDNATGCVQALEIIRVFKELNIQPNNTIRVMIYQDEEMLLSGIKQYSKYLLGNAQKHIFNLEIDSGSGRPENFLLFETQSYVDSIKPILSKELNRFGLKDIEIFPAPDVDFWPLGKDHNIPLYFYAAERTDYFDIHHSALDNFDRVDPQTLKEGAAAIALFTYIMDDIHK